jgi:hypothetical protein
MKKTLNLTQKEAKIDPLFLGVKTGFSGIRESGLCFCSFILQN